MEQASQQYENGKWQQFPVFQIRISQHEKGGGNGLAYQVHVVCQKLQGNIEIHAHPGNSGKTVNKLHGYSHQKNINDKQKEKPGTSCQGKEFAYRIIEGFFRINKKNVLKRPAGYKGINIPVGKIIKANGIAEGCQKSKQKKSSSQIKGGCFLLVLYTRMITVVKMYVFFRKNISQSRKYGNRKIVNSHDKSFLYIYILRQTGELCNQSVISVS